MLRKLTSATKVLRETWRASRVPPNAAIVAGLAGLVGSGDRGRSGVSVYLQRFPALGGVKPTGDWTLDASSSEARLPYESLIFAPGVLRVRPGLRREHVIVFLHGHQSCADDVLDRPQHGQYMRGVAERLGMSLACWDWPLQGQRRDRALYLGLGSVIAAEREYARVLPALGTSLWREGVAELAFALAEIRRWAGRDARLYVVGWSMGACFAYVAPLLGTPLATTVAAGSCARIADLIAEGKTRLHGYFFYPLQGLAHFDLDDVVHDVLAAGHALTIVHGDADSGCLASSRRALVGAAARAGRPLPLDVLPGVGHAYAPTVRDRVAALLASV